MSAHEIYLDAPTLEGISKMNPHEMGAATSDDISKMNAFEIYLDATTLDKISQRNFHEWWYFWEDYNQMNAHKISLAKKSAATISTERKLYL